MTVKQSFVSYVKIFTFGISELKKCYLRNVYTRWKESFLIDYHNIFNKHINLAVIDG